MIPAHPRHLEVRPGWDRDAFAMRSRAGRAVAASPKGKPRGKPGRGAGKPGKGFGGARGGKRR